MTTGTIGMIATPAEGRSPEDARWWAADNGCFGKGYPGDTEWLAWLSSHAAHADRCLFATAPDVVGDAAATLARSASWLPRIRAAGYPAALVAQNGLTVEDTPWDTFDVLFLGGSAECLPCGYVKPITDRQRTVCPTCGRLLREWKLAPAAAQLALAAKYRGKWVHMGRVNTYRRWRYAEYIGCDSVDGTTLAIGPDKNLAVVHGWADQLGLFTADDDRQGAGSA